MCKIDAVIKVFNVVGKLVGAENSCLWNEKVGR